MSLPVKYMSLPIENMNDSPSQINVPHVQINFLSFWDRIMDLGNLFARGSHICVPFWPCVRALKPHSMLLFEINSHRIKHDFQLVYPLESDINTPSTWNGDILFESPVGTTINLKSREEGWATFEVSVPANEVYRMRVIFYCVQCRTIMHLVWWWEFWSLPLVGLISGVPGQSCWVYSLMACVRKSIL